MFLLLLFALSDCFSVNDVQGQVTISQLFHAEGLHFGQGYNTITLSNSEGTAVEGRKPLAVNNKQSFSSLHYTISLYTTRAEYYEGVLGHGGGVSVSEAGVGYNRSGWAELVSNTEITSLDSVLVATVDAVTDTASYHGYRMRGEGVRMLEEGNVSSFIAQYGSHYLRKIVYGGRLVVLVKFSSASIQDKAAVDVRLAESTGTMSNETHFSHQLANITGNSTQYTVQLFSAGGDPAPANVTIVSALPYIYSFPQSVLKHHAVKEVQYTGLWTLTNCPSYVIQSYLFPLQRHVDAIVHISEGLTEVVAEVEDARALYRGPLHYVSSSGWAALGSLQGEGERLRLEVQLAFQSTAADGLAAIVDKYQGSSQGLRVKMASVLLSERSYSPSQTLYLLNTQPGLGYIGSAKLYLGTEYPMIRQSAVPLYMRPSAGGTQVTYGLSLVYLMSHTVPDHYLCMGTNNWYVFWQLSERAWPEYCQWRVAHTTDTRKRWLEYGDTILLYNSYWTDAIAGESNLWVGAVDSALSGQAKNRWRVEKTGPLDLDPLPTRPRI